MKNLTLYFTSDLHGYVYPTDYRDQTVKNMGMLNIMNNYKKDGNTLIIDAGDTIQGSPFTTYLSQNPPKIHPVAQVFNTAGYDYVTLGNHEFNYGYDYLASYVQHLDAKVLCANITDKTNELPLQASNIKVLENGLKVGVIGFTTDFIPIWEKPQNLEHFDVHDTFSAVKTAHDELREQVDLLIGIYHGGFENDIHTHDVLTTSSENIGFKICKELSFDVLLTGHQHMPIPTHEILGTHIVQTAHNGTTYAKVDIEVSQTGETTITSSLNDPGLVAEKSMYEALLPLEKDVQTWLDSPVGHLNVSLQPTSHLDMALHGTPLANFINQIQLEVSGADIACTSFANSIKGFNQDVTVRDIVSTYVYPNTLIVRRVTGAALKSALEVCASYFELNGEEVSISRSFVYPKESHYNYDYFANLTYKFDITKPIGERVVSMVFEGEEVTPKQELTLAMNNYRSSGVGGYECYLDCEVVQDIQVEMTELIINYFHEHKQVTVDPTTYFEVLK